MKIGESTPHGNPGVGGSFVQNPDGSLKRVSGTDSPSNSNATEVVTPEKQSEDVSE